MLVDEVTAKICIPKIVFNICDARKMKSDEFFLYHTVISYQTILEFRRGVARRSAKLPMLTIALTMCNG